MTEHNRINNPKTMGLSTRLVGLLLGLILAGCSADVSDYQHRQPALDIKQYFTGSVSAWGMLQDYSNKVTRRFCVDIDGSWQGNQGTLAEGFYFDDGEVAYRNWQLTKLADGKYTGSAEDVVGIAQGQERGFAFHWQYQLAVSIDGDSYNFSLDDWLYQLDEYRLFNRTEMSKFGVKVAEITLFFSKNISKIAQAGSCRDKPV